MNHEMSILQLVINASPVVQGVMILLLLASVLSWALIIGKSRQLRRARQLAEEFEEDFWGSSDISGTYSQLTMRRGTLDGLERIFEAGFSEFGRLRRKTSKWSNTCRFLLRWGLLAPISGCSVPYGAS